MENTLENKAKFFAQYWGQPGLIEPDGDYMVWFTSNKGLDKAHLKLKPLSSITDEDAIQVANYLGWQEHDDETRKHQGIEFINNGQSDNSYIKDYFNVADYLRSKGYALPYMGLSVETMVEYGWIKIAE